MTVERVLVVEDEPTTDGRMIRAGETWWEVSDLPLPLLRRGDEFRPSTRCGSIVDIVRRGRLVVAILEPDPGVVVEAIGGDMHPTEIDLGDPRLERPWAAVLAHPRVLAAHAIARDEFPWDVDPVPVTGPRFGHLCDRDPVPTPSRFDALRAVEFGPLIGVRIVRGARIHAEDITAERIDAGLIEPGFRRD